MKLLLALELELLARGTLGGARTTAAQEKARESARLGAADKFIGLQQQDLSAASWC